MGVSVLLRLASPGSPLSLYRFYAIATRPGSAHFLSDWLMFKIVERDWLMNLRGTVHRFDKTNVYKIMKQNNDGKCLFLISQ